MQVKQAADEFLFYLEVEKNVSEHTLHSYAYDVKVFVDFLMKFHDSTRLVEIHNSTIRRFIQDQVLRHHTKPRTLQRRISCLKSFSTFCCKEKWIETDFMAGIKAPKADKRLPVYLTHSEVKKLFQVLENDTRKAARRNELMIKFLATTGLRRQELVDLN